MGQGLSDRLAQKIVIENRPGAGSNVGTEVVVRAPPDGYTLLLVSPSNALNKTLYEKLNFDFINDIAPIASICQNPYVMNCSRRRPESTWRMSRIVATSYPI
jgi:tripartite-type tricarboxylate transporter receptor subunit TctC